MTKRNCMSAAGLHRPRVVHLTSVHSARDNRIFDRECRYLAAREYSVTLIAPHAGDETIDSVRIRAVPAPSGRRQRICHVVPSVYRRAIEEGADLYHFHDPELIPVALFLRRRNKKVIYDVHEDYPSSIRYSPWLPGSVRPAVSWCFRHLERYASERFSALIGANPEITRRMSAFNPLTVTIGNYPSFKAYPFKPRFDNARYAAGALVSFGGISSRTCARAIVEALGRITHGGECKFAAGRQGIVGRLIACAHARAGLEPGQYARELPVSMMLERFLTASIGFILFSPEPNHFGVGSNRFFEVCQLDQPYKQLLDSNQ